MPPRSSPGMCWTSTEGMRCDRPKHLVPKLCLGTHLTKLRFEPSPPTRNGVSRTGVTKQSLGTRRNSQRLPMNPTMFDAFLTAQRKAVDESLKTWKRFSNFPKVPRMATRVHVGSTPHDVVYEEDTLKLLRYQSSNVAFREPILICYALVNRPYILDLQPSRSVVQQLLKRGFNVYLIDWGVPTAADRTMRLHDYVCGLMKHVGDFVRADAGSDGFHLFG